jgi:hypothetical protein
VEDGEALVCTMDESVVVGAVEEDEEEEEEGERKWGREEPLEKYVDVVRCE